MPTRKSATQQRHNDEASRRPYEDSGHQGFWMNVDGETVHVLGDSDMDVKTANAVAGDVAKVDPQPRFLNIKVGMSEVQETIAS